MAQNTGGAAAAPAGGFAFRLYDFATGDDDARLCRDIPDDQCREQPHNFIAQVSAQALSKIGDTLDDPKVVLPWLLGALGAPHSLVGLLVPIRESLALLPQMLVGGYIRRYAVRKYWWVAASAVEGLCVLLMAGVALIGMDGGPAGWTIIALLTVFSLARGVASIAAKDTMGKTVSKGRRGRVSGHAATVSGIAAAAVGLYLAFSPEAARPEWSRRPGFPGSSPRPPSRGSPNIPARRAAGAPSANSPVTRSCCWRRTGSCRSSCSPGR
jgi:hypothetical protein